MSKDPLGIRSFKDAFLAASKTPPPQTGEWTLTAPDGRTWKADSPLKCCGLEQRERVPANVALARIVEEMERCEAEYAAKTANVLLTVGDETMTDQTIEQEIQAKGLTAPRVTPQQIEDSIAGEYFFTAADATKDCPQFESLGLLTFCVLVLKNGFTVTGESACASPENFNKELGQKIARLNAIQKIWPLEGYLLRERLHEKALRAIAGIPDDVDVTAWAAEFNKRLTS